MNRYILLVFLCIILYLIHKVYVNPIQTKEKTKIYKHNLGLEIIISDVSCIIIDTNVSPNNLYKYNKNYADKKGYDYMNIKITNEKLIEELLKKYYFVVTIGDGIIIANYNINIEDIEIGKIKNINFAIYSKEINNKTIDNKYLCFHNDKEYYREGFLWDTNILKREELRSIISNLNIEDIYLSTEKKWSKDKIAVVSCYTENIYNYVKYVEKINKKYCDKYGYDFFMDKMEINNKISMTWYKLFIILKYLELGYRYVLWIDSDAIFYDIDIKLEDFLQYFKNGIYMVASSDKLTGSDIINTGVMFFQNDEWTVKFLKKWNTFIKTPFGKNFKYHEQTVFSFLFNFDNIRNHTKVLYQLQINSGKITDEHLMNEHLFILHAMSMNKEYREKIFKTISNSFQI